MSNTLPERPNLDWYRKAAKKSLKLLRASNPKTTLADAQLAIARQHGATSWRALVAQIALAVPQVDPTELIAAIARGDLAAAKRLLKQSPKLTASRDAEGAPMLSLAVESERPEIVKLLLDLGANPYDTYGRGAHTPLSWAMTVGSFKSAEVLLKAGVRADLFCAAGLDRVEYVAEFFDSEGYAKAGASTTGSSRYDGQTLRPCPPADPVEMASDALYIACRNGRAKTVKFLLTQKVDLAFRAYIGGTPLHWAYFSSSREVIQQLLLAGADAEARDDVLRATPRAFGICVPASWGMMTLLKRRLAADPAAVNLLDARGTPLHEAASGGQLGIAKTLLKAGADRSIRDAEGKTPADLAKEKGHDELAKLLAPADAKPAKAWSVDALPAHRKTHKIAQWKPIMDAAFIGDAAAITKLLKGGADPNVVSTTPAKYRPLHRAIEFKKTEPRSAKHLDAVKALLAGGADPTMRGSYDNCSVLALACFGSPQFVPLLEDRFKPFDIFHAAVLGDDKRVALLLKKDKTLAKAVDANQWSPLHYAAASELHHGDPAKGAALVRIAKILLAAGADVMAAWNYNDEWPLRPLYYAAGRSNHAAMTELLLQGGADPCDNESVYHASDEGHDACLALIEKYVPKKKLAEECTKCLRTQLYWGHTKGASWLLAHGADPNALRPETGYSALHYAAKNGASEKVIALLLKHGGDPKQKTKDGKTAIELAKAAGKARVVQQLKARM